MKVNIKPKTEEQIQTTTEKNTDFDSKLDALKFTSEVHSKLKKNINSDFVLCILEPKEKEAIIEMTTNAYFVKRIMEQTINKMKVKHKKTKDKTLKILLGKEIEGMKNRCEAMFDSFLTRIYMTVLLNRNVPSNHLLKLMAGNNTEEPEQPMNQDKMADTIIEKLKKNQS